MMIRMRIMIRMTLMMRLRMIRLMQKVRHVGRRSSEEQLRRREVASILLSEIMIMMTLMIMIIIIMMMMTTKMELYYILRWGWQGSPSPLSSSSSSATHSRLYPGLLLSLSFLCSVFVVIWRLKQYHAGKPLLLKICLFSASLRFWGSHQRQYQGCSHSPTSSSRSTAGQTHNQLPKLTIWREKGNLNSFKSLKFESWPTTYM